MRLLGQERYTLGRASGADQKWRLTTLEPTLINIMTVRFYLYLFSVKLVPKVVHGQRLSKWKNEIIKKSILLLLFIFSYWEWKLHEVLWAQMIDFKLHHCFCLTYKSWHIDSLEYACSHMNDTRLVCSCACENMLRELASQGMLTAHWWLVEWVRPHGTKWDRDGLS